MPVIHWFRRDLRLTDNTALAHAAQASDQVIPLYVLSTWKGRHAWTGPPRQKFLVGSLDALAKNLSAIGSRMILRAGNADEEIRALVRETGASAVYFNRDPDPYGHEMEHRVLSVCRESGAECNSYKDCVLHEPDEVLNGSGNPYRVFTPYSRTWLALAKPAPQGRIKSLGEAAAAVRSLPLPELDHWELEDSTTHIVDPGERAARQRMKTFVERGLAKYAERRNFPAEAGTSRLSQDLRFGLISIRELYQRGEASLTYRKELAWREFYMAILRHFPEVLETEFNPDFRDLPWPGSDAAFERWGQGRTGFPIVDAGMRELLAIGFMHNRVRMIASMFLTKDLHWHWKSGESVFMQHLVDGEIASNNGGWQWSAGTGADAAPYFRIQNPWTQAKTYDLDGAYIKRWVPELADVPARLFSEPPRDGRPLHPDYVLPMVDHATERAATLEFFGRRFRRR